MWILSLTLIAGEPDRVWAEGQECVVILHGIARTSASMAPLAAYLDENGYSAINIDYPSTDHAIDDLVERVHEKLLASPWTQECITHYVGYSMGALIARGLIHKHRPEKLGRVVLLAPPNEGSEVADFWKNNFLYEWLYGPAGQELGTQKNAYRDRFGEVDFEVGVIAGDRSIDPLSSSIIPGPDDGKVSIPRTKLPGMKDHIVVHATHTFIMKNEKVMKQTLYFLKHGAFKEER
ncbi:pimeloyl-ACP methyl ester carboxylesterase [Nitrospina gracilis]|nr:MULTISPECIES: alpha/beta fold hydrolase [Nitrospina]MCF8724280.1 pimeloyl-ACP methyl ester carboxylesterase [Nitrospina sp. Nb-3]